MERDPLIDLDELMATLDVWGAMWRMEERQACEGALLRVLLEEPAHPLAMRLNAWAACRIIGMQSRRVAAAAAWSAGRLALPKAELARIATLIAPMCEAMRAAHAIGGRVGAIEHLVRRSAVGQAGTVDYWTLQLVDARDLTAVALSTTDIRVYDEAEIILGQRGRHTRERLAHELGFRVIPATRELDFSSLMPQPLRRTA